MKRLIAVLCAIALLGGLVSCSLGRGEEEVSSAITSEAVSSELVSSEFEMPDLKSVISKPMPYPDCEKMLYPVYRFPGNAKDFPRGEFKGKALNRLYTDYIGADYIAFINQDGEEIPLQDGLYNHFEYVYDKAKRPVGIVAYRGWENGTSYSINGIDVYNISGKLISMADYITWDSYGSPESPKGNARFYPYYAGPYITFYYSTEEGSYTRVIDVKNASFATKPFYGIYDVAITPKGVALIDALYSSDRSTVVDLNKREIIEVDDATLAQYKSEAIECLLDAEIRSVAWVKNAEPYEYVTKGMYQGYIDKNGEWVYRESRYTNLAE
ncbi:MAG: hypothetical protein LBS74_07305 [Oscillospiraceae bacterium]|nr:hypothetical protein [Oscillospiraceae bacterium]